MKNTDWKSYGIMLGISAAVFIIGTIVNNTAIVPHLAARKAKKTKKEASGKV